MSAGTVPVRLLVTADRKLRHVSEHRAAGHMDVHVARSFAAFFSRYEIDFSYVRNEIGMENAAIVFREVFAFLGKKFRVTGIKAVLKHVVRVVDKFWVAE